LSIISFHSLDHLLHEYGYLTIFLGIMLEAVGLPLPGESLMIAAAIYAATGHELNIFILVFAAAVGAIAGEQIGYGIGRWVGLPALKRWGGRGWPDRRTLRTRALSVSALWRTDRVLRPLRGPAAHLRRLARGG
jgi:membrane protein DedA with SNARE-associated domain